MFLEVLVLRFQRTMFALEGFNYLLEFFHCVTLGHHVRQSVLGGPC